MEQDLIFVWGKTGEDVEKAAAFFDKHKTRTYISHGEVQLAKEHVESIDLESGIENHAAHAFFEKRGFEKASVVMQAYI